jgi:hypothetical protein
MDFLLDSPEAEKDFQQLLDEIKLRRNGELAASMKGQGLEYKMNWGVPVVELRKLAREFNPGHLLALKLWNKQWRETMILATLLDKPEEVTEEQMDFWTKSFDNQEIAEQASANLWVKTKFAFVKALEWCRGKKHLVRFTGIHLMGRLAITQKNAIDEMFDPFFEELAVVGRDPRLNAVIYRTVIAMGTRSKYLNKQAVELAKTFQLCEQEDTMKLGEILLDELTMESISFDGSE